MYRYGTIGESQYNSCLQVSAFLCRTNNRVALITGSLSGIGLGIAHSLAVKGYNIILNGFASDEEIKKTTKVFQTKYPDIEPFYIFADLTKRDDCKKIVDETLKKFGRIDVLINNAGMQHID